MIKLLKKKMTTAMDLNILWRYEYEAVKEAVKTSLKLGYEGVAINYCVNNFNFYYATKKKQKTPQLKDPDDVKLKKKDFADIKSALGLKKDVRQYSRITVKLEDSNQITRLQRDEIVRKYDIIAVRPTTEKLMQVAAATLDIDIISLDLKDKIPFKVKSGCLNQAFERGIMLEISYSPMIRDSGHRRYIISNGNMLASMSRGKNIILTSACEKPIELRGPYDVQNLASLFNMSDGHCKDAVFRNPGKCVIHGESAGKRASKCVITIKKVEESEPEEDKKEEESMDFIQLPSDSEEEARTAQKHKLNSKQHTNHSPRKKLKT